MTNNMPASYKGVVFFMLKHSGPKIALLVIVMCLGYRFYMGWVFWDFLIVGLMFSFRGFLEWSFHSYIWHSRPLPVVRWRIRNPVAVMHTNHHKNPYDSDGLIFGGIGVVLVCALLMLGGWLVFNSLSLGISIVLGFMIVLLNHEWHHVLAHSGINPVSPLFRKAVMCHRLHHQGNANTCMGVSSVLADKVLGTYEERKDA